MSLDRAEKHVQPVPLFTDVPAKKNVSFVGTIKIHPAYSSNVSLCSDYSSHTIVGRECYGEIPQPAIPFVPTKGHYLSIAPHKGGACTSLTVQVDIPAIRGNQNIAFKNPFHPFHLVFSVQYWKKSVDGRTVLNAFFFSYSTSRIWT